MESDETEIIFKVISETEPDNSYLYIDTIV